MKHWNVRELYIQQYLFPYFMRICVCDRDFFSPPRFIRKHDVFNAWRRRVRRVDMSTSYVKKGFSSLKCCVILCHCHMWMRVSWVDSSRIESALFSLSLFLLCNPCFHNFPVILINCNAEQQFRSYTQTNKLQIWFVKCDVFYTSLRSSGEMINESSFSPDIPFRMSFGDWNTPHTNR